MHVKIHIAKHRGQPYVTQNENSISDPFACDIVLNIINTSTRIGM